MLLLILELSNIKVNLSVSIYRNPQHPLFILFSLCSYLNENMAAFMVEYPNSFFRLNSVFFFTASNDLHSPYNILLLKMILRSRSKLM
jgi:hypothetical protein